MTSGRGHRRVAALLMPALTLGLVACETTSPDPAPTPTASLVFGADQTTADGFVSVEIAQGRSDYASGTIAVRVEAIVSDVTVHSVALSGDALRSPARWGDGTVVPEGTERDLRMAFPGASCATDDARTHVAIDYTVAGVRRSPVLDAADPHGVIERLADRECFAAEVAAIATLELADAPVVVPSGDGSGDGSGVVALVVGPSEAPGSASFTIESIDATTLLEPAGGGSEWPVDLAVTAGDATSTIPLHVAPARCDAHAVAEDKVGTILPVRIRLASGEEGVVPVAASDELRAALYDFVAQSCDW